ncbi:MAG: hypothetical protein ACXVJX_05575 [Acidimicrobiia bacterium]
MGHRRGIRAFACVGISLALTGGALIAAATPAAAASFSMTLVGGSFALGSQQGSQLQGAVTECQDGVDNELHAPFGSPDGQIDFGHDPDCTSIYDNSETQPGFQAPAPIQFTGTIDGSGNFSVAGTFAPMSFVTIVPSPTAGVCDGDVLVTKATTAFSALGPQTGNLLAGTLDMQLRLDTSLDIQCDTDLGAGTNWTAFDFDGAGGMNPWGGATPVQCAHDVTSTNPSLSGDTDPGSLTKVQDPTVATPMSGGNLKPVLLFGDVFDAIPIATPDTRCGFFNLLVFGTAGTDNSTSQWAFILSNYDYTDLPGIDVNVGDVTIPEGDGGLGTHGCGSDCKNTATVVVSLSSPATVASTVQVIADNTTGGSANGTGKGTELTPKPADYKATPASKPRTLKFAAGKSTAKFTIPITPDQTKEPNETIAVKVVGASAGLTVNDDVGIVTIVDDDDSVEPDNTIAIGDATVYETGASAACGGVLKCLGTAVIPIQASHPALVDRMISYTVTSGSDVPGVFVGATAVNGKTAGDDFRPVTVPKVKVLKAGKTSLALVVPILADNVDENGAFSAETFTVTISGADVGDAIGTVRLMNDDT